MRINVETVREALSGRPHRPAPAHRGDRLAAVAAILREHRGEAEILLIRRATSPGDPWSGHMALPGGRREESDRDLLHTAIRETEEEVGIRLSPETDLVGRLDDMPAIAGGRPVGLIIAPFVFAVDRPESPVANQSEVHEVLWTPVSPLARGERNATWTYDLAGEQMNLPAFDVDGRIVWGLTYKMLRDLFHRLDASTRAR